MKLRDKINSKEAVLAVIGLGYVGLPLAVEKAKSGYLTFGFDVQEIKVNKVNLGINYIGDVDESELKKVVNDKKLIATLDTSKISEVDCICICVPTPLDKYQQPNMSYIKSTAEIISKYLTKDTLIILESTTYPGTTRELIKPILEESGLICGKDFYLAFSPERVDPGNLKFKTKNTPKVVGGITPECTNLAALLYEKVLSAPIHKVSSPEIAEMEKILENTYRNVNIGLINELAVLCEKMNINIWEVIEAADSKPYGFQAFYPGPGLGGHCIPLDPYYLSWKAREFGFHTSMIESSMVVNDKMPDYCVERSSKILNRMSKSLKNSKILVLGVAYKNDVSDYRESPALEIINLLEKQESTVEFYDPYIDKYNKGDTVKVGLTKLNKTELLKYDLVIIATGHKKIDYSMVQKYSHYIFDLRNAMSDVLVRNNIELL